MIQDHFRFLSRIDPLRELVPEDMIDFKRINTDSCWNEEFQEIAKNIAKENGIQLFEGVYTWTSGPTFETVSETKMAKDCGGGCLGIVYI